MPDFTPAWLSGYFYRWGAGQLVMNNFQYVADANHILFYMHAKFVQTSLYAQILRYRNDKIAAFW